MKMRFLKSLFSGFLTLGLVFSTFIVAFAAGGTGGGGGGGTGGGSGSTTPDPVTFVGAYLTTITDNVSTTGEDIRNNTNVIPNPTIKLVFDKNVVNSTVWDNNIKTISMKDSDSKSIGLNVNRIPDEGTNSNPDEKRNIFISPVEPLTLGKTYTITINSSLTANNTSTLGHKETVTFTVKTDVTAPALTVVTPNNTVTNNGKVTVSGSTEAGSVVKINDTRVTVNVDGSFSQEITLLPGLNKIVITSTDTADNTASAELFVTFDNAAPIINISSPADNTVSNTDKVKITGSSEKDAIVTVNDSVVTLDSNNAFSQDVKLIKGSNTIKITSTDAAGNTSVVVLHVTYDDTVPAGNVTTPAKNDNQSGTTTVKNSLPETASNTYNWMYTGLLIIILGIAMAVPRLRKR